MEKNPARSCPSAPAILVIVRCLSERVLSSYRSIAGWPSSSGCSYALVRLLDEALRAAVVAGAAADMNRHALAR